MLDLDKELRGLLEHPPRAPEPIETIRRRARRHRHRRRMTLVAASAAAALVAGSIGALMIHEHGGSPLAVTTTPDRLASLASGWHRLGTIPAGALTPDQAVWTGRQLVIWSSGNKWSVAFDPATGRWRKLPASPLAHRANVVMVWTGREVLVWGGYCCYSGDPLSGAGAATPYVDGAAYNPTANSWRRIPDAPIKARLALGGVWTGTELIVSGGPPKTQGRSPSSDAVLTDGAAYNPSSDSWRRIPAAPIPVTEGVVRWTGHDMLVFGSLRTDFPDSCKLPATGTLPCTISDARGALYDPAANQWHTLPPSGIGGVGPTATFAGRQVVAVSAGYQGVWRRYSTADSRWHDTTGGPATSKEGCGFTLSGNQSLALLSNCGEFWTFDTSTNRSTKVPSPPVPFDQQPWGEPVWTGHAFVYWQTNPWLPGPAAIADPSRKDLTVWAYVP